MDFWGAGWFGQVWGEEKLASEDGTTGASSGEGSVMKKSIKQKKEDEKNSLISVSLTQGGIKMKNNLKQSAFKAYITGMWN